ncbi:hypothetical protein SAY87_009644 [Trapa incisa]|uniref:Homeobox domain-containing protein n=1 Tax=Trapa incisa TaxID=236973 RepID=A0AAN7JZE2_9MYRT|nr:hypothetical protein SAY87_009644 [Trapa incisa]
MKKNRQRQKQQRDEELPLEVETERLSGSDLGSGSAAAGGGLCHGGERKAVRTPENGKGKVRAALMALAPSVNASCSFQFLSSFSQERVYHCFNKPCSLVLSPPCWSRSFALSLSRRRDLGPVVSAAKNKKKAKRKQPMPDSPLVKDEDLDDDAFEALFKQLEEDLKNDEDLSFDDDDVEISEEDFSKLENELKGALGDGDDIEMFDDTGDSIEECEDDEDIERPVKLKRWQLRRLASALKTGRRKTNIKSLASELGLDRVIVLKLLRDPPPNLLMMSATLPDEPEQILLVPQTDAVELVREKTMVEVAESVPETKVAAPVHVMHQRWSSQKRLKKVQVETLQRVYRRTKRPTNAMISSIVQVTSLPRKRIVKWFEDRRAEDGVPDQRVPYQRPEPETTPSH